MQQLTCSRRPSAVLRGKGPGSAVQLDEYVLRQADLPDPDAGSLPTGGLHISYSTFSGNGPVTRWVSVLHVVGLW